jgi:hypothetical protein
MHYTSIYYILYIYLKYKITHLFFINNVYVNYVLYIYYIDNIPLHIIVNGILSLLQPHPFKIIYVRIGCEIKI